MAFKLTISKNDGATVKFELVEEKGRQWSIGRDPVNEICLDDPMVSRVHAKIIFDNGVFSLIDNDSINGLIFEDTLVKRILIENGTQIDIPPFSLKFVGRSQSSRSTKEPRKKSAVAKVEFSSLEMNPGAQVVNKPKSLDSLIDETGGDIDIEKTELEPSTTGERIVGGIGDDDSMIIDLPNTADFSFVKEGPDAAPPSHRTVSPSGSSTMIAPFVGGFRIFPLNMPNYTEPIELTGSMKVGRSPQSQIHFDHASVSQNHAEFSQEGTTFTIEDLGSSNGTRVNGDLIESMPLQCHDIIEFGDIRVEFLEGAALPQTRSNNVIEIAEDPNFSALSIKSMGSSRKLFTMAMALGCLALVCVPFVKKMKLLNFATNGVQSVSLNSPNLSPEETSTREKNRIVKHQINQAKSLIQRAKYDEAKVKVDLILEKLDPENFEAQTLGSEINQVQSILQRKERDKIASIEKNRNRILNLAVLAGNAFDQQRFQEAKTLYRQILAISPNHSRAKSQIVVIDQKMLAKTNKAAEFKKMEHSIEESFKKGMAAYNANNLIQTAKYLRQVTMHSESKFYSQAKIALDDVEEKLVVELDEKLSEARDQYVSGQLIMARQLLRDILESNPEHQEAIELKGKVFTEARDKAKKLYREGYTFEHLVQDQNGARSRYQMVLDLLPETDEEYHQKAKSRLNSLD